MRAILAIFVFALTISPSQAQAPPQGFQPRLVYDPPPASLELPTAWDIESIRAARGNVARWRDAERQRLGPYEAQWRGERQVVRNALPAIGGYFAFLGDERFPGGVVEARWDRPSAELGQSGALAATYTTGRTICGGAFDRLASDIGELTFLGSNWRPEFGALDIELGALAPLPAGRTLPDAVVVPVAQPPTGSDFARFYPRRAYDAELEGVVGLNCLVREDLSLLCGVVSESPEGFDFGAAAQRIMQRTRVAPLASDGQPTPGACTRRRVNFAFADN